MGEHREHRGPHHDEENGHRGGGGREERHSRRRDDDRHRSRHGDEGRSRGREEEQRRGGREEREEREHRTHRPRREPSDREEPLPGPPPRAPQEQLPGPPLRGREGPPPHKRSRGEGGGAGGLPPPPPQADRPQWGKAEDSKPQQEPAEPVEPEFGLSGALAAEANTVRGVALLHAEPPEARKPPEKWRLYTFKNGEPLGEPLYIHRQTCYLFGRERRIVDVPTDHPSCSKQHAVLQYRLTEKALADGLTGASVKPYLLDLGSTNGSFINGEQLEAQRYYELLEKDMLRFGNSSREYILLHDKSAAGG